MTNTASCGAKVGLRKIHELAGCLQQPPIAAAQGALPYSFSPSSPFSTSRRSASERDGFGSGCRAIHAFSAASSSG